MYAFSFTVFAVVFCLVIALFSSMLSVLVVLGAAVVATLATLSVRVAPQWERVVVLRAG